MILTMRDCPDVAGSTTSKLLLHTPTVTTGNVVTVLYYCPCHIDSCTVEYLPVSGGAQHDTSIQPLHSFQLAMTESRILLVLP